MLLEEAVLEGKYYSLEFNYQVFNCLILALKVFTTNIQFVSDPNLCGPIFINKGQG